MKVRSRLRYDTMWVFSLIIPRFSVVHCCRHQRSCGNVTFLHLPVILSTGWGGVCHTPWAYTPYAQCMLGIRSTSGRHASYWNAFLLVICFYRRHCDCHNVSAKLSFHDLPGNNVPDSLPSYTDTFHGYLTLLLTLYVPFQALQDDGLNPDEVLFTHSDKTATTVTPVKPTIEGKTRSLVRLQGFRLIARKKWGASFSLGGGGSQKS